MHPWPFEIDKITLLFRVNGYVGFLVWGILIFLIINWKFKSINYITKMKDDKKRTKLEKVLKFMNYLFYFVIFQLVLSSLDVLLMAIGIFNSARLPIKAIIMAAVDVPFYFLVLFVRFMIRSALNSPIAECRPLKAES